MEGLFSGIYIGKTVLVTGHTGFKGSWLTLWLNSLGARVVGYGLPPDTEPNLFNLMNLQDSIVHIIGDVRDASKLCDVLRTYQPDIVFHLAAQSLVRYSYTNPVETYATNVMGTIHLFEAIRETPSVRVCVNVTSDKCYENREWVYSYRENDSLGGLDPYSSSKGCAELVTVAYRNSFFTKGERHISLASARAGNVIGGGDWAHERIIPDCVRALTSGKPVLVRNPQAIRPWQYVLEPLPGYLRLGACLWGKPGLFEEAWNFGPNNGGNLTVGELVDQVISLWGEGTWVDISKCQSDLLHEARTLKLDITKATHILGWEPVFNISQALEETVRWYSEQHRNPKLDVKEYMLKQIHYYVQSAKIKGVKWAVKYKEQDDL